MLRRARVFRFLAIVVAVGSLLPGVAGAGALCTDVVILSRTAVSGDVGTIPSNPWAFVCRAGLDDETGDQRIVVLGANQIQVRYAPTPPPAPGQTVSGSISGSLLPPGTPTSITLTARDSGQGLSLWVYQSDWIPIRAGQGSVTATVNGISTTYHAL